MLLAYGFTVPKNPFDIVLININAPTGSPLEEARSMWRARNIDHEGPGKLHIRSIEHPDYTSAPERVSSIFSISLLANLSTLVLNDREVKSTMFQRDQTMVMLKLGDSPVEWQRNIVATCAQLAVECRARLDRLNAHDSGREGEPSNTIQAYAKVYRDSQHSILNSAYQLCEYELLRSRSDTNDPVQVLQKEYGMPQEAIVKLNHCIKSKSFSMMPEKVMLSSAEAVDMLDDATRQSLQEAIAEMKDSQSKPISGTVFNKIIFTVFLAYADLQKGLNPTGLSRRLESWLRHLDRWYPVTSQTDLTLPTDELLLLLEPLLNISPEDAWSQELICWAWSVVEEEAVTFPDSHTVEKLTKNSFGEAQHSESDPQAKARARGKVQSSKLELLLYFPKEENVDIL